MSNEDDRDDSAAAGPVQVYIFNQTYNLRSGSDEEYVRRVARVVDERMRQISSLAPYHDDVKVAVLAALHMADELEQVRESQQASDEEAPTPRETTDAAAAHYSGHDADARGASASDEDAAASASEPSSSSLSESSSSSESSPSSPASSPSSSAASSPSSWFDDFFDSEFTGNRGGDRLGDRLSERLHTRRQDRRRPISIDAAEGEGPSPAPERRADAGEARDTRARD